MPIEASREGWYNKNILRNPVQHQLKQTFNWLGIFDQLFYEIGNTKKLNAEKLDEHLEQIFVLGKKLVEKHPY